MQHPTMPVGLGTNGGGGVKVSDAPPPYRDPSGEDPEVLPAGRTYLSANFLLTAL